MRNRRKSSVKVITTVALFIVTALAVAVGIVTVFALTQHSVDSSIFIRYTATDIDGSVKATYQLIGKESKDNGEVVDMGTINFSVSDGTSDHEISPAEDLKLTKATPHIEFTYIFTNNGSRDFTATVSLKDVIENNNISFNYAYQNYDYLSESFSILVQGVETGKNVVTYKIKMGVESFAKNAGFKGALFWDLKTPEIEDEATQMSVDSLNFTDKSDGTYSATFNGGEIKDNTLVIPNEINGVKITSVGLVRNLPRGATIVISEGITSIENKAFYGSQASNIELPDSLEGIEDDAFNSSRIETITIPKSLTDIGQNVFNFSAIVEIIIDDENTVFSIMENCLVKNSTVLIWAIADESKIANGITEIFSNAFVSRKFKSIHIPSSVTKIYDGNFFSDTPNLESITADEGGTYKAEGNCLIEGTTLIAGCKNSVIPDYITKIGSDAFRGCSQLTSINLPSSVETIELYAFIGCSSLTSISLPPKLKRINAYTFSGCKALTTLTITENIEQVYSHSFANCTSLTEVYILSSDVHISENVFQNVTATIYCVAPSKPESWAENWAPNATEIIWGYNN